MKQKFIILLEKKKKFVMFTCQLNETRVGNKFNTMFNQLCNNTPGIGREQFQVPKPCHYAKAISLQ